MNVPHFSGDHWVAESDVKCSEVLKESHNIGLVMKSENDDYIKVHINFFQ